MTDLSAASIRQLINSHENWVGDTYPEQWNNFWAFSIPSFFSLMISLSHKDIKKKKALIVAGPKHLLESELDVATGILKMGSSQQPSPNLLGQLQ